MNHIRAASNDILDFRAQAREIGGQDAGCDTVHARILRGIAGRLHAASPWLPHPSI